jgi:hypothetical protein
MSTSTVRGDAPGGASKPSGGPVGRQRGGSAPRSRSVTARGAITLTGRGGIVTIFAAALLGALLSRWLDLEPLAGAGFVVGCAVAALTTRPSDLLTLAVCPPLLFLAATLIAEVVTALGEGSLLRGVTVGLLTSLAATAPWVFLGTILVVVVTAPRGLLAGVGELRGKLARTRLFEEEENQDPVRWDERPAAGRRRRRPPPKADVD